MCNLLEQNKLPSKIETFARAAADVQSALISLLESSGALFSGVL
jgi:hypothetical protein